METIKRVVGLGGILLILVWVVYFKTIAIWYEEQEGQLEHALTVGQKELLQLENHVTRIGWLEEEITQLEMLAQGIRHQLPARQDQMVIWERLLDFCKDYEVEAVTITWLGEGRSNIGAETIGVDAVRMRYVSDYENSLRLIGGLRQIRQFHSIEAVTFTQAPEEDVSGRMCTTIELGVYYDKTQTVEAKACNLLTLVEDGLPTSQVAQEEAQPEAQWQLLALGAEGDKMRYRIQGKDYQDSPYVLEIASRQSPVVSQKVDGDVAYLVVETVEGERVKQWLGR